VTDSGEQQAVLLISCRDAPGIVAGVSGFLAEHGANILDADQHVDPDEGVFFQRVACSLKGFSLPRERIQPEIEALLAPHRPRVDVRFSDRRKRAAILVSRADHCLYDLLLRQRAGELNVEVPLIVSNREDLRPVADHFGVPYHAFPTTPETKRAQEDRILELLDEHKVDFVVLARYMQVLTSQFVDAYPARIINIHHSFLPAFRGARPYHQAHRRGVKIVGATGHYVTADLDTGPIIAQDVVRVSHRDSVQALIHKGTDLEKVVLARAVRYHVEDRVLTYANKTVVFA
jgi:formyltetrahydrofolate deformylase